MKTLKPFDTAQFLDNDTVITAYLAAALEDPNPKVFLSALGEVAKAKGMKKIAQDANLSRESLYKALRPEAKPRYETIYRVMAALGVKLIIAPLSVQ